MNGVQFVFQNQNIFSFSEAKILFASIKYHKYHKYHDIFPRKYHDIYRSYRSNQIKLFYSAPKSWPESWPT